MIQSKLETRVLNQSGYQIKFKNYARTHEKKKKKNWLGDRNNWSVEVGPNEMSSFFTFPNSQHTRRRTRREW
jgi:hypothetical protein